MAGIRTPQSLTRAAREEMGETAPSMEEAMPQVFAQFSEVVGRLERRYRDMQDIEFTVEQGRLYMLQTRNGKRTAKAALKVAVDLVAEGVISQEEAVQRVEPASLDQLLHPAIDPAAARDVIASGLPASPGAAVGEIVFDADEAERLAELGKPVILVRDETSPEDIHGMHAARGIVTCRGGMTSHAAVVARGMGRPCVSGAGELRIDLKARTLTSRGRTFHAGEVVTIDGSAGEVLAGAAPMIEPELSGDFAALMIWADRARRMKVRANAETPLDARTARGFGAEGIGLCRTEHMFFDETRIAAVREMILADDEAGRRAALAKILPFQRSDFEELFEIMAGLPVTIRLLDPPLHEFLPHTDAEIERLAALHPARPGRRSAGGFRSACGCAASGTPGRSSAGGFEAGAGARGKAATKISGGATYRVHDGRVAACFRHPAGTTRSSTQAALAHRTRPERAHRCTGQRRAAACGAGDRGARSAGRQPDADGCRGGNAARRNAGADRCPRAELRAARDDAVRNPRAKDAEAEQGQRREHQPHRIRDCGRGGKGRGEL